MDKRNYSRLYGRGKAKDEGPKYTSMKAHTGKHGEVSGMFVPSAGFGELDPTVAGKFLGFDREGRTWAKFHWITLLNSIAHILYMFVGFSALGELLHADYLSFDDWWAIILVLFLLKGFLGTAFLLYQINGSSVPLDLSKRHKWLFVINHLCSWLTSLIIFSGITWFKYSLNDTRRSAFDAHRYGNATGADTYVASTWNNLMTLTIVFFVLDFRMYV